MEKIDAHQHFWKFDPVRDAWITNEMHGIQKDFMPGDLYPLLQQHGFTGTVLVQSDQSEEENVFQLKNASTHDFIKGVVGWVDLQAGDVEERLAHYAQFSKMKGFRHVLQGETDRALMLKPSFKKGISLLSKYNFTYDILIFPDQLEYAAELVKEFPDQMFVIDHIAKPGIKNKKIAGWKEDIQNIAEAENVYCKISGMVTEADLENWKKEDFYPYMDIVVEAFGTNRIMYGSDWPVCLLAASYGQVLELVKEYFSSFSKEEQDNFFGENAFKFYNLN
jgi:L-fuconolactonase